MRRIFRLASILFRTALLLALIIATVRPTVYRAYIFWLIGCVYDLLIEIISPGPVLRVYGDARADRYAYLFFTALFAALWPFIVPLKLWALLVGYREARRKMSERARKIVRAAYSDKHAGDRVWSGVEKQLDDHEGGCG